MSINPFARLRALLAGPPLQVGTVTTIVDGLATVQLPGGNTVRVRGSASVGSSVFFRDGVIEGDAPALPVVNIEV